MTISELIDLLSLMKEHPGEVDELSELDHALQCAYELSRVRPDDAEIQAAGLVHDIGHHFGPDETHGLLGAEHVRDALGERVAILVEAHVPAKRFLVATDTSYRNALSAVSTATLALQGGPLSPQEVAEFSSSPFAADALLLRRADDDAKVPGRDVPSLPHWLPILKQLAS